MYIKLLEVKQTILKYQSKMNALIIRSVHKFVNVKVKCFHEICFLIAYVSNFYILLDI